MVLRWLSFRDLVDHVCMVLFPPRQTQKELKIPQLKRATHRRMHWHFYLQLGRGDKFENLDLISFPTSKDIEGVTTNKLR